MASTSTENNAEFDVVVRTSDTQIESFVSWDGGMNIGFYSNSNGFKKIRIC